MNTYTLIALFMLTGDAYVERRHLTLDHCAARAVMARREFLAVWPKLEQRVGEVRYLCVPTGERLPEIVMEFEHDDLLK